MTRITPPVRSLGRRLGRSVADVAGAVTLESPASRFPRSAKTDPLRGLVESVAASVGSAVERTAFWVAIPLPVVLVGLTLAGLNQQRAVWFAAVLLVNVAAVVLGHGYEARSGPST